MYWIVQITYISVMFPLQLTLSATKQEAGVVVVCQDSVQAIGLDVSQRCGVNVLHETHKSIRFE